MFYLIVTSFSQYFLFYLFNYTLILDSIKSKVEYKFNIFKVTHSWKYNLLYPLFCPLCFVFHTSWMLLCLQHLTEYNLNITLWNLTAGPIIAILLDNTLKITGKHAS